MVSACRFTGQEDQSTGTIILAIIVVIIAFCNLSPLNPRILRPLALPFPPHDSDSNYLCTAVLFFMLGGPSEPSSASQEIADLEAKYVSERMRRNDFAPSTTRIHTSREPLA